MAKLLIAYGEHGKGESDFNWCDDGEPVGAHGFVCCSAQECGCGRSFQGVRSTASTTMAIVRPATDEQIAAAVKELRESTFRGWDGNHEIVRFAVRLFEKTCEKASDFPAGTIVKVLKGDSYDSFAILAESAGEYSVNV